MFLYLYSMCCNVEKIDLSNNEIEDAKGLSKIFLDFDFAWLIYKDKVTQVSTWMIIYFR